MIETRRLKNVVIFIQTVISNNITINTLHPHNLQLRSDIKINTLHPHYL